VAAVLLLHSRHRSVASYAVGALPLALHVRGGTYRRRRAQEKHPVHEEGPGHVNFQQRRPPAAAGLRPAPRPPLPTARADGGGHPQVHSGHRLGCLQKFEQHNEIVFGVKFHNALVKITFR